MITFKVVDALGSVRYFRFGGAEIRIGYRPGADISLEPFSSRGAEIRIFERVDCGYFLEMVHRGGDFTVGGKGVEAPVELSKGDVIITGDYRILVDDVAAAVRETVTIQGASSQSCGAGDAGVSQVQEPAADACHVSAQSGESHLVLFFAPVRQYLDDDDVSEIMINGPGRIYVERRGKMEQTDARFVNGQALEAAVKNVARNVGRNFNAENPRLDARFPDGSRVHAVMAPLARCGTVVAIRKFRREKLTMNQLVQFGSISPEGAELLDAVVKLHKNVVVSGPTSSGKTSVLNVLSGCIQPRERIIVIEDASELQLQQEHVVQFETRKPDEHGKGEVTMRDLVASSLRLRPDRLVIGEIRGGEALDMLQAMNTGHSGSMSTIHANSAVDCLSRIETCAMLSGVDIPLAAIRSQVASAINVVIHTARLGDGSRRITGISEVMPLKDGEYAVRNLMVFRPEGTGPDGRIAGRHSGCGEKPTFYDEARISGVRMCDNWFEGEGS